MSTSWGRIAIVATLLSACVVYNTPVASEVPRPAPTDSVLVSTPVKAHLLDGSTVLYPAGIRVERGLVHGTLSRPRAFRYGPTLQDSTSVAAIPLDSVMGFETFQNSINAPATIVLSVLGGAAAVVGTAALAVAIFGSCPTVYTDSAGSPTLEAEGFSYSIAPLFEARDVDALRGVADSTGTLRLEVRNEAMETHYINQLGVLQVYRGSMESIVPVPSGPPLAVRDLTPPGTARDRSGRDVAAVLVATDGRTFRSAPEALDRVSADDVTDAIDLTFPRPVGQDTAVIVLRLRNSLLNTVLLYDLMLGDPGLRSLDWMGRDLQRVGTAARLGQWYGSNFGLRVAVRDRRRVREVGRVADTGPIAWKDVAVLVPVPAHGDSLRIRLSFVTDDWRIDRVGLAGGWRHLTPRSLAPVAVTDSAGRLDSVALAGLQEADEHYAVTYPGTRFFVRFAAEPAPADSAAAYLLVTQGYYIEWLRGQWIQPHLSGAAFRPGNDALVEALRRWRRKAPELERRFYATRIPVR